MICIYTELHLRLMDDGHMICVILEIPPYGTLGGKVEKFYFTGWKNLKMYNFSEIFPIIIVTLKVG